MELLDTVALLEDIPFKGLVRGQVGAFAEVHDSDKFEVELVDTDMCTYGLTTLRRDQVVSLMQTAVQPVAPPELAKGEPMLGFFNSIMHKR